MKFYLLLSALCFAAFTSDAQRWKDFRFESGDLLFQDLDCGELCNAIEAVSQKVNNRSISHVGIAYVVKDSVWVIEAYGEQVQLIQLQHFMDRQTSSNGLPKVMVGRITAEYQNLAGRAVGFSLEQRGKPIDREFTYDNGKYYSSELVFDAYKSARQGKTLIEEQELSFINPFTGKLLPEWDRYFKRLNMKPPEGTEGILPASIANDEHVEIVISFF